MKNYGNFMPIGSKIYEKPMESATREWRLEYTKNKKIAAIYKETFKFKENDISYYIL